MTRQNLIFPLLLAACSGSLMAVQGAFNSTLGKIIGYMESLLVVQLTGTALAGILILTAGNGNFAKAGAVPWYAWLGGVLGVGIVLGVIASISRLGVGLSTTAIIAAQLLTAYLIDHCGWFGMERIPFNLAKLGGIILIVAGAWLLFPNH
ncbi:MAG: DMT family transporter [Bacillota bacterium]|jgi:transporter family-2 protein